MMRLEMLKIDGEDYTEYAVWTLQGQNTLDESLDLNYIELKGTKIELPFKPFLDVSIILSDTNGGSYSIDRLVESDTVTEIISNKTYNHNLLFIEETKWLERLFVEKTVRQPLIHDYSSTEHGVTIEGSSKVFWFITDDSFYVTFDSIKTPVLKDSTHKIQRPIYLIREIQKVADIDDSVVRATLRIVAPDGTEKKYFDGWTNIPDEETFDITYSQLGDYTFYLDAESQTGNQKSSSSFKVSVIEQAEPKPNYTIRDVINQLLETCMTLRENEQPIFRIAEPTEYSYADDDYRKQIQAILDTVSPEFTFSKMSLFEALKMIGDFAHFIPRLNDKRIFFDLLGRKDDAGIKFLGAYCSNVSAQNSNDFCNGLDSQVSNLTNMDDESQGAISTPDSFGYRTLRAETGEIQIKEENVIIPTEDNIEKIISLEIGYLKDGTLVGDITPYVFEEDEYKTLSTHSDNFPTSRMYAIKYKQGSKNITGLTFERPNAVSDSFENIAIKNIIYKKINKPLSKWKNLWEGENTFNLQYRLTYIPSTNTRVTQQKQNIEDISTKPLYIAYNQSAGKVSSNAYGENLKGTIAKIGNIEKTKMYILPTFDLIPRCGTLFDKDYYISTVKYEVYSTFIKCEVGLSKNYNNKSSYVEINSQLEFFEYNRNITIDRYVVYEEFCQIADNRNDVSENETSMISYSGLNAFFEFFNNASAGGFTVQIAKAQGFTEKGGALTEVVLPVISLGVGNSLLFTFHYEDTISAGTRAFNRDKGKFQDFVKYTDVYGEMDKLKLSFGAKVDSPDSYSESVSFGDNLPLAGELGEFQSYFETGDNKLVIRKGVGEAIHFTYQIHFVTKNKDFVIGSGLTRKNPLTNSSEIELKLYALTREIGKFETKIDLTSAVEIDKIKSSGFDTIKKSIKIDDVIAPNGTYKSWAIVQVMRDDNKNIYDNDLILGKNISFNGGETLLMPVFMFKRRIK